MRIKIIMAVLSWSCVALAGESPLERARQLTLETEQKSERLIAARKNLDETLGQQAKDAHARYQLALNQQDYKTALAELSLSLVVKDNYWAQAMMLTIDLEKLRAESQEQLLRLEMENLIQYSKRLESRIKTLEQTQVWR